MSGYALDNSWDGKKRRLALLEFYLDPDDQTTLWCFWGFVKGRIV